MTEAPNNTFHAYKVGRADAPHFGREGMGEKGLGEKGQTICAKARRGEKGHPCASLRTAGAVRALLGANSDLSTAAPPQGTLYFSFGRENWTIDIIACLRSCLPRRRDDHRLLLPLPETDQDPYPGPFPVPSPSHHPRRLADLFSSTGNHASIRKPPTSSNPTLHRTRATRKPPTKPRNTACTPPLNRLHYSLTGGKSPSQTVLGIEIGSLQYLRNQAV